MTARREPRPPRRPRTVPVRSERWRDEVRRKAIHLTALLIPVAFLYPPLAVLRTRAQWTWLLATLVAIAIAVDLVRLHERRVRRFFRSFFGGMLREHEEFNLLGSTYLLLAALLAVDLFPRSIAAGALGFTVVGDSFAAMVGKAWGRTRFFHKTLEGAAAGLVACLLWASFLAGSGHLPWTVAIAGALLASLVELLPIPLDDNLGMTLFAGYLMRLMMGAPG